MQKKNTEIMKGTLKLIILRILNAGDQYGYSLAQEIKRQSNNLLNASEGSLYPALYKLEQEGAIKSRWDDRFTPRRKYYSITDKGREQFASEKKKLSEVVATLNSLLS